MAITALWLVGCSASANERASSTDETTLGNTGGGPSSSPSTADPTGSGAGSSDTVGVGSETSTSTQHPGNDSGSGGEAIEVCDQDIGLLLPLPECSDDYPCTRVATELDGDITTASDPPACADPAWDETLQWVIDGVPRYACVFRPTDAVETPRPLVIFFHPGGTGADAAEQQTRLLRRAPEYDLNGVPGESGFALAIVQGRNLHFPTQEPRDGRHHDFYNRDLAEPSSNPDVASADALIDILVAEGSIDASRIYVMGWSNGGFFGQLYAAARHETPTAGGNRVAAAAVFAAGNPFDDIERNPFTERPHVGTSCKLSDIPPSSVPTLLIYRTCDVATPCGASDAACFGNEPGFVITTWLRDAASSRPGLQGRLIGGLESGSGNDGVADACTNIDRTCNEADCASAPQGPWCQCLVNHLRWPDGDYDGGPGIDNEPAMLDFLRSHPLR